MTILESILLSAGLCADCFAVSLCSSVTIRDMHARKVAATAAGFAIIQTSLLLAGWAFGSIFVGMVYRVAHIIGFLLLAYVGGGMLLSGIRGEEESRDLNGLKNVVLGGIATSIDALAVGVAQSMAGTTWSGLTALLISVLVITAISVVAGICGGKAIGRHFGRWAVTAGGIVLLGIGVSILLG